MWWSMININNLPKMHDKLRMKIVSSGPILYTKICIAWPAFELL